MKSSPIVFFLLSLFAPGAQAKDCTPVFTQNSRSIRQDVAHMSGSTDETVDFDSQTLLSVPTPSAKNTPTRQRKLEAAELGALKQVLASLCLKKAPANGHSPPGGSFFFDIQDKDGSKRRLAYFNPEPSIDFYPLSDDEASRLGEAWPGLEGPRPPVPAEDRVKRFLVAPIFGEPGGGPDLSKASARLDPKQELFEVTDLGHSGGYALQVQLRLRSANSLDVKALASALDVASPMAYLANGEHGIWVLGSREPRDTPLSSWRGAEFRVELVMPAKTQVSSTRGETRGLDGVGVRSIIVRTKPSASPSPAK